MWRLIAYDRSRQLATYTNGRGLWLIREFRSANNNGDT